MKPEKVDNKETCKRSLRKRNNYQMKLSESNEENIIVGGKA